MVRLNVSLTQEKTILCSNTKFWSPDILTLDFSDSFAAMLCERLDDSGLTSLSLLSLQAKIAKDDTKTTKNLNILFGPSLFFVHLSVKSDLADNNRF